MGSDATVLMEMLGMEPLSLESLKAMVVDEVDSLGKQIEHEAERINSAIPDSYPEIYDKWAGGEFVPIAEDKAAFVKRLFVRMVGLRNRLGAYQEILMILESNGY